MNKQDCYSIGYISKTHGLKGEVTAVITEPLELDSVESVFIELKGSLVPYFIQSFSDRGDKAFIKFEDVSESIYDFSNPSSESITLQDGSSVYVVDLNKATITALQGNRTCGLIFCK